MFVIHGDPVSTTFGGSNDTTEVEVVTLKYFFKNKNQEGFGTIFKREVCKENIHPWPHFLRACNIPSLPALNRKISWSAAFLLEFWKKTITLFEILEICCQLWSKNNENMKICCVNVYSSTWLLKYLFFNSNRGQLKTDHKENFCEFGALTCFSPLIYPRFGYLLIHTIWIFHYLPILSKLVNIEFL